VSPQYAVTIKYPDGQIVRATVSRETLKGFRLSACRDCSVSIVKVS
jgi:hypothetical protein